jgi:hypothetical protein
MKRCASSVPEYRRATTCAALETKETKMTTTIKSLSAPAIAGTLVIASLVASSDASAGGGRRASVVVAEPTPVSRNLPRSGSPKPLPPRYCYYPYYQCHHY